MDCGGCVRVVLATGGKFYRRSGFGILADNLAGRLLLPETRQAGLGGRSIRLVHNQVSSVLVTAIAYLPQETLAHNDRHGLRGSCRRRCMFSRRRSPLAEGLLDGPSGFTNESLPVEYGEFEGIVLRPSSMAYSIHRRNCAH